MLEIDVPSPNQDDDFFEIVGSETDDECTECTPEDCPFERACDDVLFMLFPSIWKYGFNIIPTEEDTATYFCNKCRQRKRITFQVNKPKRHD